MALGVYFYLLKTNKWGNYLSLDNLKPLKEMTLLCSPLLLILAILFIGNGGIDTSSISHLFLVLGTQILIVAFIEEIFYRGFMLNILISKGFRFAVLTSSVLFGLTHSLQLLGGQSLEQTILQIMYAFFTGLVLSLLIVNKQSILVTIIFHGLNNSFIMLKQTDGPPIYLYLIVGILIVYAAILWMKASKAENTVLNKINNLSF
ncbi:CPBP family intramembrane glutamic endopeptidase [Falsibacillus albus]|uniref:CPBP family intramembrane glutamic endopeptidase n=1 Tax=Falsibacillus albus TaxID=2478915 RepID=UPI001F45F040|nr:CPBP family intramembrane glutamic endopeptidase [Falsibacillus albus]